MNKPIAKFELLHDSLAQTILVKASSEMVQRRKVEQFIKNKYELNKAHKARLSQDDLKYIDSYLEKVNISEEEHTFIKRDRRRLRSKRRGLIGLITASILVVTMAGVAVYFWQRADFQREIAEKQRSEAEEAREMADKQTIMAMEQRQHAEEAGKRAALAQMEAEKIAKESEKLRIEAQMALRKLKAQIERTEQAEANVKVLEQEVEEVQQGSSSSIPNEDNGTSLSLTTFAKELEDKEIMYNSGELSDASGIALRMLAFLKSKDPSIQVPTPEEARNSRSIAGWFNEHGSLTLIEDPTASRNLIKPGSVMFYGSSGKSYSNFTVAQLVGTPQARGIIIHVGVVTEIKADENGDVIGYVLMHGHRPGKSAQRSHYHSLKPPRLGYPILGNWNQQWVAVANPLGK